MCDVHKLKLGLKKCDDNKIKLTVEENGVKIDLCDNCWGKVSKKKKFYKQVESL